MRKRLHISDVPLALRRLAIRLLRPRLEHSPRYPEMGPALVPGSSPADVPHQDGAKIQDSATSSIRQKGEIL
jgi:hypothetical protein